MMTIEWGEKDLSTPALDCARGRNSQRSIFLDKRSHFGERESQKDLVSSVRQPEKTNRNRSHFPRSFCNWQGDNDDEVMMDVCDSFVVPTLEKHELIPLLKCPCSILCFIYHEHNNTATTGTVSRLGSSRVERIIIVHAIITIRPTT